MYAIQQIWLAGAYEPGHAVLNASSARLWPIWDSEEARFTPEVQPYISALPIAAAFFLAFSQLLAILLPKRPAWATNFVNEHAELAGETEPIKVARSLASIVLFFATVAGSAAQTVQIFFPVLQTSATFAAVGWIVILILLALHWPRRAPAYLLCFYPIALLGQCNTISHNLPVWRVPNILPLCSVACSSLAIVLILSMPLRDPRLSTEKIAKIMDAPDPHLRSPEDNLTPWYYMTVQWISPLISLGSKRQLNEDDIWALPFEFDHLRLHTLFRQTRGKVIHRLLRANGLDIFIMTGLGMLQLIATYSSPLIFQQLLRVMSSEDSNPRAAATYAAISLILHLISTQCEVFNLWYGRRGYERARGELITMIHEKTLSRQNIGLQPEEKAGKDTDEDESSEDDSEDDPLVANGDQKPKAASPLTRFWTAVVSSCTSCFRRKPAKPEVPVKQPSTIGKILNLLRGDVYQVAQMFWDFQEYFKAPLDLILSVLLVLKIIGWPCLLGAVTVICAEILNFFLFREARKWRKKYREATDVKLQKISQFIEAIRHLRWYGWESSWLKEILESRQKELRLNIIINLWSTLTLFVTTFSTYCFPVVAFYAYTQLAGRPLSIDVAFPALDAFMMLNYALQKTPNLINYLLDSLIALDRLEGFMAEPDKDEVELQPAESIDHIDVDGASFAWPGTEEDVLKSVRLHFPVGLNVIFGEVAAGKSALLQAILGELNLTDGAYQRPNVMIGYYAQSPWLQNMSIRENILFGIPYDAERYRMVLEACALTPDLAGFKHGDLSDIGENGIGLSGGQKARVALARAVYSPARILLLDDPLSALDFQTAETIVQKCFQSSLVRDRVVILVTHRTELCRHLATQMIRISEGTARKVEADEATAVIHDHAAKEGSKRKGIKDADDAELNAAIPDKIIEEEHRSHGEIRISVYWQYMKAGHLKWWAMLLVAVTLQRCLSFSKDWFVKAWAEAYSDTRLLSTDLFSSFPNPNADVRPWVLAYFLIAVTVSIVVVLIRLIMMLITYLAARGLFKDAMEKVSHATFRFYDVTPVGRLMNRMTSDISTLDGNMSQLLLSFGTRFVQLTVAISIIATVAPIFLIFSTLLSIAFVLIFLRFLPTSQSLRRLEMVSLSPLMSNFGVLLQGLTTVRAFCAEVRFQDKVIAVTDAFQRMDHFYWSVQAWLTYRTQTLSGVSSFVLTLLSIFTRLTPGLTAFVLTAAEHLVYATQSLCRQYGRLQLDFVSVERVIELLNLEQEKTGDIDPPAWWPTVDGDINFENVTIRYAANLDPALSDINVTIKGGSNTAVIGRTGSGKSTFALSLLATLRPESGRITVQNIDLNEVNVKSLRSRVTFLAQDPVLFPGTMRQNLDPLSEHTDKACEDVLRLIAERHGWTLTTTIDTGGKNLSQGQRQLVGLARAVLRRSSIIILDEATASIDQETSLEIQKILRTEMASSTVITIAHRLEAVRNADYCIVLGQGRVLAQGPADEMLDRQAALLMAVEEDEEDTNQTANGHANNEQNV